MRSNPRFSNRERGFLFFMAGHTAEKRDIVSQHSQQRHLLFPIQGPPANDAHGKYKE